MVLNREIWVGLFEKLMLEQRFEGANGVNHAALWGFPRGRKSPCKTVRPGPAVPCVAVAVAVNERWGLRGDVVSWLGE